MSLLQSLSGLANRHLGKAHQAALRNAYRRAKSAATPVMRAWYGPFDCEALRRHLEAELPRDWSILFVHSSLQGLQPAFNGAPLDLVRMLIAMTGPERTIAMPAFYFGDPAIGGAGKTFLANPRFDLKRTPSQMGLPSELFRRSAGVVQSRNPVYRVAALGPLAAELVQGHETAPTLCGAGTPFDVMARRDALIIGIGKPFEVLTQVHHPEDVMGEAFPVPRSGSEPLPMTLVEGRAEIPYALPRSGFRWRRDMWKLRRIMDRRTLKEWSFHGVPLFATRAGEVSRAITEAAGRGLTLYDPA